MTWTRLLPLSLLLIAMAIVFATGLDCFLTLDRLRDNRTILLDTVERNRLAASFGFVLAYAGIAALSLPGSTVMTLAGGFLFGVAAGATLTVIGATLGATTLFLIARTAVGDFLRRKAGPLLARFADGFNEDAFNYVLVLRLVPVLPFWAVNLVSALLGMRLVAFIAATGLGIVPATIVYATFGSGLGNVFDAGQDVALTGILNPKLIAALFGLGLLALVPVVVKRIWGKQP